MIKSKKLGTLSMCALVSVSALVSSPLVVDNVRADEIQVENLQTTYSIDNNGMVSIPVGNSGTTMEIVPVGSSDKVEPDTNLEDGFFDFKPTAKQYKVTYTNNGTVKTFIINIDYNDAKMKLDEKEVCLPKTSAKDRDILLPYPKITDKDGNDITDLSAVTISVSNKSSNEIVVVDSEKPYAKDVMYKKFKPETYGTYTVNYKFEKQGYDIINLSFTIEVKPNFSTEGEISFSLDEKIGTPEIGKEFKLPEITANDDENEIEDINVVVNLSYYVINEKGEKSQETAITDYKFTPSQEGYYVFKYQVSDAFGRVAPTATYKTAKVKDAQSAQNIIMVESYAIGKDGKPYEVNGEGTITTTEAKDKSYKIATKMLQGKNLFIPAIFATDNLSKSANLTYTRTLKRYSAGILQEEIELDKDCYKSTSVQLDDVGTYTLTYTIKDEKGNEISREYDIEVCSSDVLNDSTIPSITFSANIDESTKWGSSFTITKPSVVDYDDETIVSDKNPENHAYLYYKATNGSDKTYTTNEIEIFTNSSNKFEINVYKSIQELEEELELKTGEGEIDLTDFDITLCFKYTSTDDFNNKAEQVKEIKVVGNTEIPTVVYTNPSGIEYRQGQEITLGDLTINYATGSRFNDYLKDIVVTYEIQNRETGASLGYYGTKYDFSETGKVKVTGTKFYATYSGNYDIIITVTDINGNTVIQETKIEGVDVVYNPEIVLDKDTMTLEIGSTDTSAKIYTMYNNGQIVEQTDKNFKVEIVSGSSVAIDSNMYFKAVSVGTTVVRYTMMNEDGTAELATADLTIEVSDTKDPVMSFDTDQVFNKVNHKDDKINLPMPHVTDNSGNATIDIKVTKNGKDITVTEEEGKKHFVASEEGTYTVVYKAQDSSGNSTSQTFTVNVGDVDGPIIDIKNVPVTKEVGSYYTIDLKDLFIYDEYETDFEYILSENTTITLKDPEGNEVKSEKAGEYTYKLDKEGTYTLTITATDSSDKTTTIDKTITVSKESIDPAEQSSAGLVIAILASLLILAFVIYYFFKPEKGANSNRRKKITSKEEDKKNNKK